MKLKKYLPLVVLLGAPLSTYSIVSNALTIDGVELNNVELKKVTLFLKGAELQGQANVAIPKGESVILLTNLANNINANSINVNIGDKAMILSTTLVNNYLLPKNDSNEINTLKQSIKLLTDEKNNLIIKRKVVEEELVMLQQNRIETLTNNSGTLNDKEMAIDFIKKNLTLSLTEQQQLNNQLNELNEKIDQYQLQLSSKQDNQNQYSNVIKVKVYSPEAITAQVKLSYVSHDAGWTPNYDVRVKDINSPLVLTYKANIYQYTGLPWNNIDFTLSTANPSEGISAPILSPWHVYAYDGKNSIYSSVSKAAMPASAMLDAVTEERSLKSNSFSDYVVTNNNGIYTQFFVQLPYTIFSASKDNIVTLKAKEVDAQYSYVAVPKMDSNAFLQAKITDWDKLALLPGKSTVFFAGNYIGEGYITTAGIKDTLDISLGRDKAIIIARNQDLNETSKPSFFGNNVSQKFAYTIDVKNTKDLPIDLTVYDQLPVVHNKIITMDEAKYDRASYDKESGLLTWKLTLKEKEETKLPFSFKVDYPKEKSTMIIGL